jgi:hypothetical protein
LSQVDATEVPAREAHAPPEMWAFNFEYGPRAVPGYGNGNLVADHSCKISKLRVTLEG